MATYQEPAALKRRLLKELKSFRAKAGFTQRDVAEAMDWSPSKLIRIESGSVPVTTTDLRALLIHYEVTDTTLIEDLVATAKNSKKSSWSEYRDVVSQAAATYFEYEASVVVLRQFALSLVPGLLQTEEYMRAVFDHVTLPKPQNIERMVQARQERQQLLDRDVLPEMFFIVDEAALRRPMGGKATMQRQLERLEELAARPNISIQMIPFAKGGYGGLGGPFVLLEFQDEDTVLYLESRFDQVTRDNADDIGIYLDEFQRYERDLAGPVQELPEQLAVIKKQLGGSS